MDRIVRIAQRRWIILVVMLALAGLALAACGGGGETSTTPAAAPTAEPEAVAESRYPLTIEDGAGRTVTIASRPQRVLSVLPSVTNVLVDLGLADRIIGTDTFSLDIYDSEENRTLAGVQSIGGLNQNFNLEMSVELEPDVVVTAGGFSGDAFTAALHELGFTVVEIPFPNSVEEMLQGALILGAVLDAEAEAEAWVAEMRSRLAAATAKSDGQAPLTVYMELDQSTPTQPFSIGPGSLHDEVLRLAGGTNIFADAASAFPQVNYESIIAGAPDVVILFDTAISGGDNRVAIDAVSERTGWEVIPAVRTGQIFAINLSLISPGTRLIEAVEQIAAILEEVRATTAQPAIAPPPREAA